MAAYCGRHMAFTDDNLIQMRHRLHQQPELSDNEFKTAEFIADRLKTLNPDLLISGIGGSGIAATFNGSRKHPHIIVRCELDALPIHEAPDLPYASHTSGVAHKCGHDGHMTIVTGLAARLSSDRSFPGCVTVVYQPSEETGQGAARMIADEKFDAIDADHSLALHNLPGYPMGSIIIREGVFASASVGMIIDLHGATAHAAEPERARTPALAMAQIIEMLGALPQQAAALHEAAKVTVIHAKLGEVAFGTTPGQATVMATFRAYRDDVMRRLTSIAEKRAGKIAAAYDLDIQTRLVEEFPSTVNDAGMVELISTVAGETDRKVIIPEHPFAFSEDFGHFAAAFPGAMFGLGAGEDTPVLHHPDYDFPDQLIGEGTDMFYRICKRLMERES